ARPRAVRRPRERRGRWRAVPFGSDLGVPLEALVETRAAASRGGEWLHASASAWLTLVAASGLVGFADLAQNARGFSTGEALATELLWIGLGALLALPAWLGFRRPIAVGIVWLALQSAIVHLVQSGWMIPPLAVLASAGLLVFVKRRLQQDEFLAPVLALIVCLGGAALLGTRRQA